MGWLRFLFSSAEHTKGKSRTHKKTFPDAVRRASTIVRVSCGPPSKNVWGVFPASTFSGGFLVFLEGEDGGDGGARVLGGKERS